MRPSNREPSERLFSERIPATFIYAGIDVERQGLFNGTRGRQIAGRFSLIHTTMFPYAAEWQGLVASLEAALRLRRHRSGTLPGLDRYLHHRTAGMIGSLSHLIRGAAIEAILTGTEAITKTILDRIEIDHAADSPTRHPAPPMTTTQPPPLPIRPRPRTGEPTVSYLRRLARANHLRPRVLDRYLRDGPGTPIRLERLAALAGRSLDDLSKALAEHRSEHFPGTDPPLSIRQQRARAALFAAIRRDVADNPGRSVRFLAERHGVHRRTIHTALNSPIPPPRRAQSRRGSRLDQHQAVIDTMLARPSHPRHRTTIQEVHDHLTKNLQVKVSFSAVSAYVRARRKYHTSQNSGGAVEPSEPNGRDTSAPCVRSREAR